MIDLLLIVGALLLVGLAVHPFTTYPLSLAILARRHSRFAANRAVAHGPPDDAPPDDSSPAISICFCAYNEATVIADKIRNLEAVAAAYPGEVEILLYADGCSDETVAVARQHARGTRIVEGQDRGGKSQGMNRLVAQAGGKLIVFTDANVFFQEGTLPAIAKAFEDPHLGCACGHLIFTNSDEGDVASVGSLYWRWEEQIKSLETETGSAMGADGALFAIRRRLYRPVPVDIIDDMFTSLSILCDGYRVARIPEAVAQERTTTQSSDEFRRKIRIACRSFNCHRLLLPRLWRLAPLDRYKYFSHKWLRWLVAFQLVAATLPIAVLAARQGLLLLFFCLMVGSLGGLVIANQIPKIRKIPEILLAFLAVAIGVVHSLQGKRYQMWNPPRSARHPGEQASPRCHGRPRCLLFAKAFPPNPGGVERYSLDLALAFRKMGVRPLVVTTFAGRPGVQRRDGIAVINVGEGAQWRVFASMFGVARAVRHRDFQFTYATTWRVAIPAILARTARPLGVTIHGREVLMPGLSLQPLMRWVFRHVDHVYAVSHFTLRAARSRSLLGAVPATVNWNGYTASNRDRHELLRRAKADRDNAAGNLPRPFRLLTLCRLVERKNVQGVIRALGQLKRDGRLPPLIYQVAGEGERRVDLQRLVEAEELTDSVDFLGRVDDAEKDKLYRAADLFIHPQIALRDGKDVEGFGLVIADAMAKGVPVLAGKAGGTADFVLDQQTGRTVDGENTAAIAERLIELIDDAGQRQRLSKSAISWVQENLSWQKHAACVLETLGVRV